MELEISCEASRPSLFTSSITVSEVNPQSNLQPSTKSIMKVHRFCNFASADFSMQSSICRDHNQPSHESFPLHNCKKLRVNSSLPRKSLPNRSHAIQNCEVSTNWLWARQFSWGHYRGGYYIPTYIPRRTQDTPPRDLISTNLVVNFSSPTAQDGDE